MTISVSGGGGSRVTISARGGWLGCCSVTISASGGGGCSRVTISASGGGGV